MEKLGSQFVVYKCLLVAERWVDEWFGGWRVGMSVGNAGSGWRFMG